MESPVGYGSHRVADPANPPRELSGLAWGVYVSLGVLALIAVGRFASALSLHSAATGGGFDVPGAYHTYSTWVGFSMLIPVVSGGVFIAWFFRAYKNLRRLGVQNMRYGDGWAIGSWFIPIFNWVRPKQIANDVWRGSERGVEVWSQWRQVEVPSLVHWWWALFLAQGVVAYVGQQMTQSGYNNATTLESALSRIKSGTTIDVIAQLIAIAGVVVAIKVVSRITERLDGIRDEALAAGSAYPPAAPAMAPAMTSPPPPMAPTTASYPSPSASYPPPPPVAPVQSPPPPPAPMPVQSPPPPPPSPTEQRIQCPECAEWIQPQANICRYCGHRLR